MAQHFLLSAASRTISLKAVLRMDNAEAWATFRRLRWPETQGEPVCPHCGGCICYDVARGGSPRYRCRACRRDFSPTSGTLFAYHKLHVRDYLAAIVIFVNAVKGISSLQLARDLGVSAKAAWVLGHKLREAMASEMKGAMVGGAGAVVEVDGCYVGGHIRPENRKEDRKDRRLAQHQTGKRRVVVAVRERDGRTLTSVFRSEEESAAFIRARVERGSTIHADEAASWDDLRARYAMKRINHKEAFSFADACTNQAESFFARLRRAEWGQHHHISGLYLHRYAAEMAWREDHRRDANGTLFSRLVARVAACAQSVDFTGRWQRRAG
ncbi:IS1595 family transposase [Rhodocista pekingensis]|uniref:IS1595 family transposase n=1 Tax=Rhodocista pekingensis TaxID=201185 RepID=A0ABW2KVW2_9PROT